MSTGSWDPTLGATSTSIELNAELLKRLADYSRSGQLTELAKILPGEEQQTLAGLMTIDHAVWLQACESFDSEELQHLIRFFTMAEQLPGWEAGQKSPVIPLAKILRKRGERLEREMLLWLREVSDNRFLPYGPL